MLHYAKHEKELPIQRRKSGERKELPIQRRKRGERKELPIQRRKSGERKERWRSDQSQPVD